MLTLHQTTDVTKKIAKAVGVIVVTAMIFVFLFKGAKIIKEIIKPTPPPPPTVSFGKLPKTDLPNITTQKSFSYSLNTLSGTLPSFPDRLKVYKIKQSTPNLLSLRRANQLLSQVNFNSQPVYVSNNDYQWSAEQNNLSKKILFNVLTLNFKLLSNFYSNDQILKAVYLPNETESIKEAISFLSKISALPNDLDETKTKTTFYSIEKAHLVQTTSLSKAQTVRVDFFQKDIDRLPIFYPDPNFSTMTLFLGSGNYEGQIIMGDFSHQNIASESATYPIKTAEEVFSLLKKGKASIVSYDGDKQEIVIKNIFLGYYLDRVTQQYLIPIVIFEGNQNFYAYLVAIKDEWLKE